MRKEHRRDPSQRAIVLLIFLALTIWRLVRYMKAGLARRPQGGVPSVAGTVIGAPTSNSAPPAREPVKVSAWNRLIAKTTAALVFVVGNVMIWGCLFGLTALDEVPTIWRLFLGIFANFPLLRLAHATGKNVAERVKPTLRNEGNSPFL